jgi:hypothetical protein
MGRGLRLPLQKINIIIGFRIANAAITTKPPADYDITESIPFSVASSNFLPFDLYLLLIASFSLATPTRSFCLRGRAEVVHPFQNTHNGLRRRWSIFDLGRWYVITIQSRRRYKKLIFHSPCSTVYNSRSSTDVRFVPSSLCCSQHLYLLPTVRNAMREHSSLEMALWLALPHQSLWARRAFGLSSKYWTINACRRS